MLWNLLWSLPFVLVAVGGAVVAARAPQGSPWRVPALLGFGLTAASQLVSMVLQATVSYGREVAGSSLYAVLGVLGAVTSTLALVGLVLLVVAFLRVPRVAALGWGRGAPAAVHEGGPSAPSAAGGAYAPPAYGTTGPTELQEAPSPYGPPSTDAPRPGAGG